MSRGPARRHTLSRRGWLRGLAATGAGSALPLVGCEASRPAAVAPDPILPVPPGTRVAIVGAGLAGLTTARELARRGAEVTVFEARDRVGGRTLNLDIGHGHVVECGGEWIGPGQERIAALAREVRVATYPSFYDGDTTYDIEGHVSRGFLPDLTARDAADFVAAAWKLDRASRRLPLGDPWRAPDADRLDRITLAEWLTAEHHSSFTHAVFKLITRATISGHPEHVSLLWWLDLLRSAGGLLPMILNDGGAQDLRFEGGSQLVSIRCADALGERVHRSSPVLRITDLPGEPLRVHLRDGLVEVDRVVVAMMPADALRIRFEPALPDDKQALLAGWARLPRVPFVKLAVVYATPFWRKRGLNGAMQSDQSPIQLVFDNSPADASLGVVSCFLAINEAPVFADAATRQARVVDELARYFGDEARAPIGYVEKDWATDPWSTGCVTPLAPGLLTRAGPAIRRPTGRIHWAGSETSDVWIGYMDGAVRSGERAAREVAESLRSPRVAGEPLVQP
ncbi:MAG: FAD-dependent oxidoreductase [Deltaproteobacteria bacterium]|nr:FAD-dependent oxidoreductase [Deltaproteobacteria bacterium]